MALFSSKDHCPFNADGHFARVFVGTEFNNGKLRYVEERCEHCGKVLDSYEEEYSAPRASTHMQWRRRK